MDVDFWRSLAGAVSGVVVLMVGEWLCARPEAHADPRMWIALLFRWSLFSFLLVFWIMDVWVHNHPVSADAPYNRPAWVLGQVVLRMVVAAVVIGVLSLEGEGLILGR